MIKFENKDGLKITASFQGLINNRKWTYEDETNPDSFVGIIQYSDNSIERLPITHNNIDDALNDAIELALSRGFTRSEDPIKTLFGIPQ